MGNHLAKSPATKSIHSNLPIIIKILEQMLKKKQAVFPVHFLVSGTRLRILWLKVKTDIKELQKAILPSTNVK